MAQASDMRHETGYMEGRDGRLHYQRWAPTGAVRNVMVVAHGLGEHGGRYLNLVNHFVPRGFAVYAMDHRGHGLSTGIRGHVNSFLQYRDDLASFIERVRQETGCAKVVLVGHSMGALIATSYSLLHPDRVSRLILSSPGLRPHKLPSRAKEALAKALARILPTFLLSNELDPANVSRDPGVVKAYVDDPLVHDRVSPRFYVEFVKEAKRLMREASRLSVPLLFLQAGEDRLVHVETNLDFFARAGSPGKQLKLYDGQYHEVFNEPEKDQVFADMEGWLGLTGPAAPAAKGRKAGAGKAAVRENAAAAKNPVPRKKGVRKAKTAPSKVKTSPGKKAVAATRRSAGKKTAASGKSPRRARG